MAFSHGPHIYFWAYDFTKWIILPTVLLFVLHRLAFVAPREYGLSADLGKRDILYVLPLPLITLFVVHFIASAAVEIVFTPQKAPFDYRSMLSPLGPLRIVGTLYLSATAGIWESIFFIGLPWLWFSKGRAVSPWGRCAFALGTAVLFAAGHWENGVSNVIGVLLFQLVAVYWYFRFATLWPVIGAHFLIDVVFLWPVTKL